MSIPRRTFLIGTLATSLIGKITSSSPMLAEALTGNRPITGVRVEKEFRLPDNQGDTWIAAWAGDDNLYTPSDDTEGFHEACHSNIAFNRLNGSDPMRFTGTTVNPMSDYGKNSQLGPDHCNWKSTGCIWLDGAIYWAIARHHYGDDSGDPHKRQTAQNASIIKSTDFGKTWTRTAQQNYDAPMFPGPRFATPYFIQYGYGHDTVTEDNAGQYIYATSNNGFWDCGDDLVLGRVARSKIGSLNGRDWEYYTGGDGMKSAAWSRQMNDSKPILEAALKIGMTGPVYLRQHGRYFMVSWYYPAGGGKIKDACFHTVWDFFESAKPWGPWNKIGSFDSKPAGWYTPNVCPKFQGKDRVYVLTAGNWGSKQDYRLTIVPLAIRS